MKVAVYCSAKNVIPEEYLQLGDTLGTWLAQHGHTLVYGGATGGLMTRISNAVRSAGGYVIGVVPERVIQVGRLADNCNELYKVPTMSNRKQKMKDLADCFVCLPGSYGTLDEMFDVIASGTVGEHNKPVFVVPCVSYVTGLNKVTVFILAIKVSLELGIHLAVIEIGAGEGVHRPFVDFPNV